MESLKGPLLALLVLLLTSAVGVLVGVLLEDRIRLTLHRISRRIRRAIAPSAPLPSPGFVTLGSMRTSFLRIDGTGALAYTPETLLTRLYSGSVELPSEVKALRDVISEQEDTNKAQGLPHRWNGQVCGLYRWTRSRTVDDESLSVILTFWLSDYYTFLATVTSLDKPIGTLSPLTLRQKYLNPIESSVIKGEGTDIQPIPYLALGFGIDICIITEDRKVLIAKRSSTVGARRGGIDVGVVGGVDPGQDLGDGQDSPDVYKAAIREIREEIAVDIKPADIHFLGFGVDFEYYQWDMIGVAYVSDSASLVLARRERSAESSWEGDPYFFDAEKPEAVFRHLKSFGPWSTAWITAYWGLTHAIGSRRVEAAVRKVLG